MLIKRNIVGAANDLKTAYRPCTIDELLGNDHIKQIISKRLRDNKLTHTMLFSGPAGTGKTTMARIVALSLNCINTDDPAKPCLTCANCKAILNQNSMDYIEVNVGSDSGKGDVAAIVENLSFSAFSLQNKIIIFDECHKLTAAAKELLLKVMEDAYEHVYFIFCTNEPEKLQNKRGDNPFLDRCDHFIFTRLEKDVILEALENVCQFEGVDYNKPVLDFIAEVTDGIPRRALGDLNMVISEGSWDLNTIQSFVSAGKDDLDIPEVIQLSRYMFKGKYKESITCFGKLIKKYPVETIRINVAGYFTGCLKKSYTLSSAHKISKALDVLLVPIYIQGKQANYNFYNYIFKVVTLMR